MADVKWQRISDEVMIYRAQYRAQMGFPYSLLMQVSENCFLVYSPAPQLELMEAALMILPLDAQILIVVPCAAHTLGIEPWYYYFPNTRIVASATARERLARRHPGLLVDNVESMAAYLPAGTELLEPAAHGNGELWLRHQVGNTVYWCIGDAVFNLDRIGGNALTRWFMKLYGIRTGLCVHAGFRRMLKDEQRFNHWLLAQLDTQHQHVLLPCHGQIYDAPDLQQRIQNLVSVNDWSSEQRGEVC